MINPNTDTATHYQNIKQKSAIHRLEKIQGCVFDALFCLGAGIDETVALQEAVREIKRYLEDRTVMENNS